MTVREFCRIKRTTKSSGKSGVQLSRRDRLINEVQTRFIVAPERRSASIELPQQYLGRKLAHIFAEAAWGYSDECIHS